jgi:hypothetical protein
MPPYLRKPSSLVSAPTPHTNGHSHVEEDFIFVEDDFEIPSFIKPVSDEEELKFIWKDKNNASYRICIKPPSHICIEPLETAKDTSFKQTIVLKLESIYTKSDSGSNDGPTDD